MLSYFILLILNDIVNAATKTKLSKRNHECNPDPQYNFHECIESYFYELWGCQYPWNVYNTSNLPTCKKFNEVSHMNDPYDPNKGHGRELFRTSELVARTNGKCIPHCKNTIYDIKIEKWAITTYGRNRNVLITFPDFAFMSYNEYLACGWTCIIGELGGNLGFFLGGSMIMAIDLILEYFRRIANSVKMRIHPN